MERRKFFLLGLLMSGCLLFSTGCFAAMGYEDPDTEGTTIGGEGELNTDEPEVEASAEETFEEPEREPVSDDEDTEEGDAEEEGETGTLAEIDAGLEGKTLTEQIEFLDGKVAEFSEELDKLVAEETQLTEKLAAANAAYEAKKTAAEGVAEELTYFLPVPYIAAPMQVETPMSAEMVMIDIFRKGDEDKIIGLDADGKVYRNKKKAVEEGEEEATEKINWDEDESFEKIDDPLKQIAIGFEDLGKISMWAISGNKVYRWIQKKTFWRRVPFKSKKRKLKQISIGADGSAFGVTPKNFVYENRAGRWYVRSIKKKNISKVAVGSLDHIWAIGEGNAPFQRVGKIWRKHPLEIEMVSGEEKKTLPIQDIDVGYDGEVLVIAGMLSETDEGYEKYKGYAGRVYRWNGKEWADIFRPQDQIRLKKVAVADGLRAVGVTEDGKILRLKREDFETYDPGDVTKVTEVIAKKAKAEYIAAIEEREKEIKDVQDQRDVNARIKRLRRTIKQKERSGFSTVVEQAELDKLLEEQGLKKDKPLTSMRKKLRKEKKESRTARRTARKAKKKAKKAKKGKGRRKKKKR